MNTVRKLEGHLIRLASYASTKILGADIRGLDPSFQTLDIEPSLAKHICRQIEDYFEIINEVEPEIFDKKTEFKMLEAFLKRKGLSAEDDLSSILKEGYIIEVYDVKTHAQLYRNLKFLKYSSYDLYRLTTKPFLELYHRDAAINKKIVKKFDEATALGKTIPFDIEKHIIVEADFDNRRRFEIDLKHLSPLRNGDGEVVAVVATNLCSEYRISVV